MPSLSSLISTKSTLWSPAGQHAQHQALLCRNVVSPRCKKTGSSLDGGCGKLRPPLHNNHHDDNRYCCFPAFYLSSSLLSCLHVLSYLYKLHKCNTKSYHLILQANLHIIFIEAKLQSSVLSPRPLFPYIWLRMILSNPSPSTCIHQVVLYCYAHFCVLHKA